MHSILIPHLEVDSDEWVDKIHLRRGEGGLATIDAVIMDNGSPYDLTGLAVTFYAYDPAGRNIYESARVTSGKEGKVSYTVSKRLTNLKGDITVAYFEITKGDNTITTQNIPIFVNENVDLSGEAAEEYESQFNKILRDVQNLIGNVNEQLNKVDDALAENSAATKRANDAADNLEKYQSDASKAESDRATAESKRVSAESARASAEAQRVAAENQRNTAETNRVNAEQKREERFTQIIDDTSAATREAKEAAKSANDAANRVDTSIQNAEIAANVANKAADRVDESIKLATDAAGEATIAASVANETNKRANESIKEMGELMATFNTVVGSEIRYAYGNSPTTPPTDGWTATPQAIPDGMEYQWTRVTEHMSDGTSDIHYSVARQGKDGRDGIGAMTSGLFWLWVDDFGDLYATYSDETNPPRFEYNRDTGNLYAKL